MKKARIIFLIFSILLSLLTVNSIVNSYISLKYEIDEVRWMTDCIHIDTAKDFLLLAIEFMYIFLSYVLVTIIYLVCSFFKK